MIVFLFTVNNFWMSQCSNTFSLEKVFLKVLPLCYILSLSWFFIDNIAFKKPAYQQERYAGIAEKYTGANNAVDGLKSDLNLWAGQCTLSENNRRTASWWVNLESIFSIYYITIYYRTANSPWGMYVHMKQVLYM